MQPRQAETETVWQYFSQLVIIKFQLQPFKIFIYPLKQKLI
jgi:hypothetical protein